MKLEKVTITGADDSVQPRDLLHLSERFPFVEWGILFSTSRQGTPRYPSEKWIEELFTASPRGLTLSAHLCGQWVRDLVLDAKRSWWDKYSEQTVMFKRVQLNFHGQYHKASAKFEDVLHNSIGQDYIFQHDGVNDDLVLAFAKGLPLRVYPLFDRSGGAGVLPEAWPAPIWSYQGYAGGLGPENLAAEIAKIGEAAGESRIWIDMETRVRSDDDQILDLGKVSHCLNVAAPFIRGDKA